MNANPDLLESPLLKYLTSQSPLPPITTLPDFHNHLLAVLQSKDQQLQALSSDLTKNRLQLMKTTKQLKQLQDKTSMNTNSNNTGSSFMMPSEFKAQFENFMKQTVTAAMGNVGHRPKAMAVFLQHVLRVNYGMMEGKLEGVVKEVMRVLRLKEEDSHPSQKLVFKQLLKIFQDNHEELLCLEKQQFKERLAKSFQQDSDFKEIIQSTEFNEMLAELNRLIAYMLLQENRWEFIIPKDKTIQYNKKECTCIDGLVKQKDQVLMVVEGLKRETAQAQGSVHPNLKNFVMPLIEDEEQIPKLQQAQQIPVWKDKLPQPPKLLKKLSIKSDDRPSLGLVPTLSLQLQPIKPVTTTISSQLAIQTVRSQQFLPQKQKAPEPPINQADLQRRLRIYTNDAPLKLKVSSQHYPESKKKKIGVGKIAGLLTDPNFSEVIVFPKQRTKRDDLTNRPSLDEELQSRIVNRQHQIRKQAEEKKQDRIKKQKSIGKIISQLSKISLRDESKNESVASSTHLRCNSNKENQSGNILKEAVYKDIIRNKFKEDRSILKIRENDKKQALAFGDPFVAKTERLNKEVDDSRKRQENRPLKPSQQHMKRVREKHHLLF